MKRARNLLIFFLGAFVVFSALTVTTIGANKPVKLRFTTLTRSDAPEVRSLIKLAKEKLNYDLEFVDLGEQRYMEKLSIMLLSGTSDLDIFYEVVPRFVKYVDAGVVMPLDDLAKKDGLDPHAKFGNNLPSFDDGKTYMLPNTKDVWMTLYNKRIFDEAGVPYPEAEGWTWSKYIETAKKLNNPEKGIFGSSMVLEWDSYKYMIAHQMGVPDYKANGESNFDHPAFAEALKFLKDLSDVHKIQPDMLTYMSKKIPYDAWTNGNYGMHVDGGWTSWFVTDKETFPRDWKYGILPMPYPDGYPPSSLSVIGGYAVPKTTKNPEAAFKLARLFAEYEYTVNEKRPPTRVDLSEEEIANYIHDAYIVGNEADGVTVDDYMKAWFDPERKLVNEKVIGKGASVINQLFIDQGQLYMLGKQSLEETMKIIKEKADKAIAEDSN